MPGQKRSRETHRHDMNGKRFFISEGLYDPAVGRKVLPGELVCFRCVYRRILPEYVVQMATV